MKLTNSKKANSFSIFSIPALILMCFNVVSAFGQNIRLSGNNETVTDPLSTTQNTAGGYGAFPKMKSQQNTAIGYNALQINTGESNTAVGSTALQSNTSGKDNTAIGDQSLEKNSEGYDNTGVGRFALQKNTKGYNNTCIGNYTLWVNTEGKNNVAVGWNALSSSTKDENTGVGSSAMSNTSTGSYNTALGSGTLHENKAGGSNTALGYNALYNVEGSENTAVGNLTLLNNTGGSRNTCIGGNAGLNNITGSQNVFLGYGAGYSETGSNKLYIANAANNTLIYGDFSTGNVGIGTTKAYSNLSITPSAFGAKITLADGGNTSNHCGFGVSSLQMNYDLFDNTYSHVFYAGGKNGIGGTELMRIQGNGNVGIGTTKPYSSLSITPSVFGAKITLADGGNTSNHCGFGVSSLQMNYDLFDNTYSHVFYAGGKNGIGGTELMRISGDGKVSIGKASTMTRNQYKLYVQTGIITEKVTVASSNSMNWADHVFDNNYQLRPVNELEKYITENKHLPGIPTANEVNKNGIDLAEINAKLLEKIEELHLYIIQLEKKNQQLEQKNENIENRLQAIEMRK